MTPRCSQSFIKISEMFEIKSHSLCVLRERFNKNHITRSTSQEAHHKQHT